MPFEFIKQKQKGSTTGQNLRVSNDVLIGELMVKAGVITSAQLSDAIKLAGTKRLQLGQMLIMAGNINPRQLQMAVDMQGMIRDQQIETGQAVHCLKIACKTGADLALVIRDQSQLQSKVYSNKLGELLCEAGVLKREQVEQATQRSLATGLPLGRILVLNGTLSDAVLSAALDIQVRVRDGILSRADAIESLRAQLHATAAGEESEREHTALMVRPKKGVRLGELMVMAGLLTDSDVMGALELGLVNEQPIGQILVSQGFLPPELLDAALELQRRVEQGILQPLEAGEILGKISATGSDVNEALNQYSGSSALAADAVTFDKMLTMAGVVSQEDIESALQQCARSPQILAKVLLMTNYIDEITMQSVLQAYSMMSNAFLTEDDALIALEHCLHSKTNMTFAEALQELGWSATQSLQLKTKDSVALDHIKLSASGESVPEAGAASAQMPETFTPVSQAKVQVPAPEAVDESRIAQATEQQEPKPKAEPIAWTTASQDLSALSSATAMPDDELASLIEASMLEIQPATQAETPAYEEQAREKDVTTEQVATPAPQGKSGRALRHLFATGSFQALPPDATPGGALTESNEKAGNGRDLEVGNQAAAELSQADLGKAHLSLQAMLAEASGSNVSPLPSTQPSALAAFLNANASEETTAISSFGAQSEEEITDDSGELYALAEAHYENGNYEEAQKAYALILSERQRQLGDGHPALDDDLANLAGVLCMQGKFSEAEPVLRRLVVVVESAKPVDELRIAYSLNTLAGVLYRRAKYEECEPLLARALKLRVEHLNADDLEIADNLRDYAKVLQKLGRQEDAQELLARQKLILSKHSPPAAV